MYSILKDFAAPFATICAAVVAVSVTGYFARHQKNVAVRQKEIAEAKFRLDLFDKRYRIFESIFPFYEAVLGWKGVDSDKEARRRFFMSYQEAGFLFNSEIQSIYKILMDHGARVIGFKENVSSYESDRETYAQEFALTQKVLTEVFPKNLELLKTLVHPYLDFSTSGVSETFDNIVSNNHA